MRGEERSSPFSSVFLDAEKLIDEFSGALRAGSGALFVGSGLSYPSNVATWHDLLRPLARTRLDLEIDQGDDPPEIAQYIVNRSGGNRGPLVHWFTEALGRDFSVNRYHQAIARMNVGTIWTTNYDTLIEKAFSQDLVEVKSSDSAMGRGVSSNRVELIKLHGCINTSHHLDLVITQEDYEDFFVRRPAMTRRLQEDLLTKSFLFIGYSYSDANIRNLMVEARRLADRATRTHYMVLRAEPSPGDRRQALWCENLRRMGIECVLIEHYRELERILAAIAARSRGRTVYVVGPREGPSSSALRYCNALGRLLADEGPEGEGERIALMHGQSGGVGQAVVSAFASRVVERREELGGRLKLFPNPYAADPAFSGDPAMLPMLKTWRTPLLRASRAVVVLDGGPDAQAELEVARDLGCAIVPVPMSDDGLARRLLDDQNGIGDAPEALASYARKARSGRPRPEDVVACVSQLLGP